MSILLRSLILFAVLSLACGSLARAEDAKPEPKGKKAKAEAKEEKKVDAKEEKKADDKDAAKSEEKDEKEKLLEMFKLPETKDVAELIKYIESVEAFRPKNREESLVWRMRGQSGAQLAAKRILELEKDTNSPAYKKASRLVLTSKAGQIGRLTPEEQKTLLNELVTYFSDHDVTAADASIAMQAGMSLEYSEHPELAGEAYQKFAKIFSEAKDEKVKEVVSMLEGAARRANLLGNELVLKGTTEDGQPFDWASYRGRVVLVDFWATWCGPCLAELPNVKKNYELYHDKGFDVVGISLDNDDNRLHEFLEKEKLPWKTVYEKGAGWKNTNARYYGIMGIPTVILVNKEGKAISLRARGDELGKLLAKELGPAEPAKDDATKDDGEKSEKKNDDAKEKGEKKAKKEKAESGAEKKEKQNEKP